MLGGKFHCLIVVVALAIVGCATPTPPTAVIAGSKIEAPLPGSPDDLTIYVWAIDNKPTGNGPAGRDRRLVVAPGKHDIEFGIAHDATVAGIFHTVTMTFRADAVYTLRAMPPIRKSGDLLCTRAWIEEGGTPVTDKIPVSLVYKAYGCQTLGSDFVVPLTVVGQKAPLGCEFGF